MNDELFSSELNYQVTLSIVENLHRSGLLSVDELKEAKDLLLKKYHPSITTLLGEFT